MPLARPQVEGIARAIAAKYGRISQAQELVETGEIQVVVVAPISAYASTDEPG